MAQSTSTTGVGGLGVLNLGGDGKNDRHEYLPQHGLPGYHNKPWYERLNFEVGCSYLTGIAIGGGYGMLKGYVYVRRVFGGYLNVLLCTCAFVVCCLLYLACSDFLPVSPSLSLSLLSFPSII
jgi:hypothetical protein